jgi:hypothetical protein
MTPWDELRIILAEHCHPAPHKDRALQLLEALMQEERRRAAGELTTGGMAAHGFAVRPNGDITGPGHTSAFGDEVLTPNGVLWGPASQGIGGGLGGAAWGKGVGVADIPLAGGMGPWGVGVGVGGDGLAAGGAGWRFQGASRVGSGSGADIALDDEAAVLSGLALDGPPGQPLGAWSGNPVASFELDPAPPVQDSRLGAFFMGGAQPAAQAAVGAAQAQPPPAIAVAPAPSTQTPSTSTKTQKADPGPPPQGSTAVKFSSVVGGTASGRSQVLITRTLLLHVHGPEMQSEDLTAACCTQVAVPAAPEDAKPKAPIGGQGRAQTRQDQRPPPKVESKRPEPKVSEVGAF